VNLCITPAARQRLIRSTQEVLYEQDTGFPSHQSTYLGRYEGEAEDLVENFFNELDALTPTLTY